MQSKTLFLLGLCTIFSTTVSALPLDSKGAKQRLSQAAKQKVFQGKIDLDALVSNDSNDLIVEYNIPAVYKYFGITITCLWLFIGLVTVRL